MQTVKRIVTLTCCIAVCLCMAGRIRARAAEAPEVLQGILENIGIQNDLTGIAHAYVSLTEEQKLICAYLMGAFNNMYLCARGFQYNIPDDESSIKAEFIALGKRVFTFATTDYAWRSRTNEVFRQYMSSIIVYASDYDNFNNWYNDHKYGGSKTLYIPYSQDAFDAWTVWYNDSTGDGIAMFGDIESTWNSGTLEDFAFVGIPWRNSYQQGLYNNFVLTYAPIVFNTPVFTQSPYDTYTQLVIGFTIALPDSIFIQRGNNNKASSFRYGYSNINPLPYSNTYYQSLEYVVPDGMVSTNGTRTATNNYQSINTGQSLNYNDLALYAFANYNPFFTQYGGGWYPYITHVFLVDDLNSLSNPEEIYYTDSLNVEAPDNDSFIITPNGKFLNPVWPLADRDPMNILDNIINNSVDVDFNPVSEDDFSKQIVNNTTINNYYVSDTDLINVPVQWFDNPYTQQLGEDALPFIAFARDCIDTLGDFDIYMYGAIVIGLGGGIVKKLLL